jgi:hypothetical protein
MRSRAFKSSFQVSWIDRFFDWVEGLPIPTLIFYPVLYVLLVSIHHATLWLGGVLQVGQFSKSILLTIDFWLVLQMAAFHYFRNEAEAALLKFRPALSVGAKEFEKLRFSFVHMSAPGTLYTSLLVTIPLGLFFFLSPFEIVSSLFGATPLTSAVTLLLLLGSPFAFGFFYFVFRSLFLINRFYQLVKRINLFNLEPLYAFSNFTSKVGMLFILYLVLNYLTSDAWGSQQSGEAITSFYLFFNGIIAVLAFVLPLWGMHVRLVAEKERVSDENNTRLEKAFWALQTRMDKGKLGDVAQFRSGISALMDFRTEIKKIPTWPWDTGTLHTFLTALFVPLTVWLVQQLLLRTVVK